VRLFEDYNEKTIAIVGNETLCFGFDIQIRNAIIESSLRREAELFEDYRQ
jgi:hypothetical protein